MSDKTGFVIDRESNNALYSQLEEIIREQIETGTLQPGQTIPSERELSNQHRLSRMTVRRALDRLVVAGLLTRVSGKGTYVSEPKINFTALSLAGLRDQAIKMGREPSSRLLGIDKVMASGSMINHLKIAQDTPVFVIERVFFADDVPLSMHRSHIPCNYIPDLLNDKLMDELLYAIMRTKYNIQISRATETLESTLATVREALILNVAEGSPMLLLRITMFDNTDCPIEYVKVVFRGDKVQLSLVV